MEDCVAWTEFSGACADVDFLHSRGLIARLVCFVHHIWVSSSVDKKSEQYAQDL
jgi:hypothetical protein